METNLSILQFKQSVSTLMRARFSILYLNTYEEARALECVTNLNKERGAATLIWSRTQGIVSQGVLLSNSIDPIATLKWYEEQKEKSVLILKDFHPYLKDPLVVRKLRDLAISLKNCPKNIILLSPVLQIPPELNKDVTVVEMPLPTQNEIQSMVEKAAQVLPKEKCPSPTELETLSSAFAGLTHDEIENVLAKSIVSLGELDKSLIHDEKKQIVKKTSVLEFVSLPQGKNEVSDIGGLERLKEWLNIRRLGFTPAARIAGLPHPKGILLVGLPGCGKSLTAMTVSREWQLPLLRLDFGRVYSGLVGSSENNMREAIRTAEAVAPCILWLDEIEKGISGSKSGGSGDGGTSSRVFGTVLTWMQEKNAPVFVVATANDISQLPPEFLRKGRFDEIFFVDLPNAFEREEIFKIHLRRLNWDVAGLNLSELIERSEGFSGAEIEQVLVEAKYRAFALSKELNQELILSSLRDTVPLSRTMKDRIEDTRRWAIDRARNASNPNLKSSSGRPENHKSRTHSLEL